MIFKSGSTRFWLNYPLVDSTSPPAHLIALLLLYIPIISLKDQSTALPILSHWNWIHPFDLRGRVKFGKAWSISICLSLSGRWQWHYHITFSLSRGNIVTFVFWVVIHMNINKLDARLSPYVCVFFFFQSSSTVHWTWIVRLGLWIIICSIYARGLHCTWDIVHCLFTV